MLTLRAASSRLLRSHSQSAALLTRASARAPRQPPTTSSPYRPPGLPTAPSSSPTSTSSTASSSLTPSVLALSAGGLGSLCGVGGAVFLIPGLVRFSGLSQRVAAGNSLVAVTAIAATSAATFASSGHIDLGVAVPLGVAATLLTPVGAAASARVNPALLRKLLGGFMLLLAPAMPLRAHLESARAGGREEESLGMSADAAGDGAKEQKAALLAGLGAAVGFGSGLLGISGGSLFTPLIAITCPEASFRTVLGTSFAAMIVPTAVGALSYARMGCVTPVLLPPLVVGAVAGGAVGSVAALHIPEEALRWTFAVIFTVLGTRVLRKPIVAPSTGAAANVATKVPGKRVATVVGSVPQAA